MFSESSLTQFSFGEGYVSLDYGFLLHIYLFFVLICLTIIGFSCIFWDTDGRNNGTKKKIH